MLRPVLDRTDAHGAPLSITVNFVAAVRAGAFDVRIELLRRNRSTSFWFVRLIQAQDGEDVHCADATIVLALRRDTPRFAVARPPDVPPPDALAALGAGASRAKWMYAYDMRFVSGNPFAKTDDPSTHTIAWVRDTIADAFDFATLLAMADCAFPQIFTRIGHFVPVSTVSMTVYFHATADDLAAVGNDFVLYDATMRVAYDGFFDETSSLFSRDGQLLATMEQIVWYKVPTP